MSNFSFSHNVSTQSDNLALFVHIFDIIFLSAAELEEPKIGIWIKGLTDAVFSDAMFSRFLHDVCLSFCLFIFKLEQSDQFSGK